MGRPDISVAMCTFNGSKFLRAQLESIAAQHTRPDEVVICDDGSSDSSVKIINEFARTARFRVRVVINEKNLGSTKNFEQAISLCSGEIVALADQDDIWYPHKLERLEEAFLQSDGVVAAFSDADLIDDDSKPLGLRLWPTFNFNPAKQKQFASGHALKVLIRHPVVTGATMAFRRELFDRMIPMPANQVHDQWISFLLAASGRFAIIREPLMQYRQHSAQQLGPGLELLDMRGKIAWGRRAGRERWVKEIENFQQLYEKLEANKISFPNGECAKKQIKRKISHLARRSQLPNKKVTRIPAMLGDILNGNYWRYSGGWRSIASDIFVY